MANENMDKTDEKVLDYLERAKEVAISARIYTNERTGVDSWSKIVNEKHQIEIAKMIQIQENEGLKMMLEELN